MSVDDQTLLETWNALSAMAAAEAVLPCNGSEAWAAGLVAGRPYATSQHLLEAADRVWLSLDERAWQQAFESHPRIGERHAKAATATSLQWSASEQAQRGDDAAVAAALADRNRAYEERFGRIFLVCATGKSAAQMLAILQSRMQNSIEAELDEAVEQQRRITQLRLRRCLGLPAARCEDV